MAYNPIAQSENEPVPAPFSPPEHSPAFQQLSINFEDGRSGACMELAEIEGDTTSNCLGSLMRSVTSISYDLVEDDDYDQQEVTSFAAQSIAPQSHISEINTSTANHATWMSKLPIQSSLTSLQFPLCTLGSDDPIPLSHPTPDLQSLQGAYVGNVERLEKTAERLSLSSTDLGSEIRKLNQEQNRRSGSSIVNSSSPGGSIPSAARLRRRTSSKLAHVPEPDGEDDKGEIGEAAQAPHTHPYAEWATYGQEDNGHSDPGDNMEDTMKSKRPATVASNDTYQETRSLFSDFDGVHFIPSDSFDRRVTLERPPLASGSEPYREPRDGEHMVYYPAPVPKLLNLPPRLSYKSSTDRERRQTGQFGSTVTGNRQSTAWLAGQDPGPVDSRNLDKRHSTGPPQLRASVFIDRSMPPSLDIELKQSSAVATLDSILDASALAPVTAFTDHPYAGSLGAQVYGQSKDNVARKEHEDQRTQRKSQNLMVKFNRSSIAKARHSTVSLRDFHHPPELEETASEEAALRDSGDLHDENFDDISLGRESRHGLDTHPDEVGKIAEENDEGLAEDAEDEELDYTGRPATLLAELERRKKELQQRRRTAALGLGLQSTLLELDAVAQKQSEHRRQRPVTLVWESVDLKSDDEEDDDVPLAMLYPQKKEEESRPLGLMEKREIEENEPLSRRRARLRGDVVPPSGRIEKRPGTRYSMQIPVSREPDSGSDDEGETLAERLQRLKVKEGISTVVGSDFVSEIMEALSNQTYAGLKHDEYGAKIDKAEDEEEEETLAHRRKRLQAEGEDGEESLAQRRSRLQSEAKQQQQQLQPPPPPSIATRRSMADVLQAHPVPLERKPLPLEQPHPRKNANVSRLSTYRFPANLPYAAAPISAQHSAPALANSVYNYGMGYYQNAIPYADPTLNHLVYGMPAHVYGPKIAAQAQAMNPGQREMIDRWRQTIR